MAVAHGRGADRRSRVPPDVKMKNPEAPTQIALDLRGRTRAPKLHVLGRGGDTP